MTSFEPASTLGDLTYTAANAAGGTHSSVQFVLGDRADRINQQAARHVTDATGILHWSHLARVLIRAVRARLLDAAKRERRRATCQAVTGATLARQASDCNNGARPAA